MRRLAPLNLKYVVKDLNHYADVNYKGKVTLLAFPLYSFGLRKIIKQRWARSWNLIQHVFAEIWEGVASLHSNKIAHLDLKPDNIMMNDYLDPVIIDFDSAFDGHKNHYKI